MKRTLKLTIEVEVEDLPEAERGELLSAFGCDEDELGTVMDIDAKELGEFIALALSDNPEWMKDVVWPASEMFAQTGAAKCTNAEWD